MVILRCTVVSAIVLIGLEAVSHGLPIQVTTMAGGEALALAGSIPLAELENDGFDIAADDPGIGVGFASSGPPAGARIGIETLGGLKHWDGSLVAAGDTWLTIEAPEFDSLATPNDTAVLEYQVFGDSPPQTGMSWSRYPGASFGDAHGFYVLRGGSGAPSPGVYGVATRLVDLRTTGALKPSEPFWLMFRFDPLGAFTSQDVLDASEAFAGTLLTAGDYDGNGVVDASDYDTWRQQYGDISNPPGAGADGNANGVVDLADYTVWRDAVTTNVSVAIPESSAAALQLIFLYLARLRRLFGDRAASL